jgi:hypothetical protein
MADGLALASDDNAHGGSQGKEGPWWWGADGQCNKAI